MPVVKSLTAEFAKMPAHKAGVRRGRRSEESVERGKSK